MTPEQLSEIEQRHANSTPAHSDIPGLIATVRREREVQAELLAALKECLGSGEDADWNRVRAAIAAAEGVPSIPLLEETK